MNSRFLEVSVLSTSVVAGLVFLLWPSEALAWGPLAHLNFSSGALCVTGAGSGAALSAMGWGGVCGGTCGAAGVTTAGG